MQGFRRIDLAGIADGPREPSAAPFHDWNARITAESYRANAYARIYGSSTERTPALPLYLDRYNHRRPHGRLNHQPPASRLNNVVGNYN